MPHLASWLQVTLIVFGAAGLGALLVTGAEWRKPSRESTLRALAGGALAAIVALAFASGGVTGQTSLITGEPETLGGAFSGGTSAEAAAAAGGAKAGGVRATAGGGGAAGQSQGGATSIPPASTPSHANLPPIKIGYIGLNPQSASGVITAFVPNYPKPDDPQVYATAMQDWINTHGGVNGRRIQIVTKQRDPQSSNPNQLLDICKQLTEGDKVFSVVGTDSDSDADLCYAQHRTPFICGGCGIETADLKKNAPWLWTPGSADDVSVQVTEVTSFGQRGFFANGTKLGVLVRDVPGQWDIWRKKLRPIVLKYHKYTDAEIDAYPIHDTPSTNDYGQYTADIQQAVSRFKLEGINRVFFLYYGDLIALYFMDQAESQDYHPRYGVESGKHPYLTLQANVPQSQLHNSIGVGFQMVVDVDTAHGDKYPAVGETECYEAAKAKGMQPTNRVQAVYFNSLCDGIRMFRDAAVGFGPSFTGLQWTDGADHLGTRFQAAVGLPGATRFRPGRYVGIDAYRELTYVDNCPNDPDRNPSGGCYQYTSKNIFMPSG
jgi:hypothetical protein